MSQWCPNYFSRSWPLLLLLASLSVSAQQEPPRFGYRILNSFPHDMSAFTQGLVYHEGFLYEGTGKRGRSTLKKIKLEDGQVLMERRLADRYFGEGIEIVGNQIFQLTWQSHKVFVYDKVSFELLDTHHNATEGWGLAYDGEQLILSDGSAELRFIDPATFATIDSVEVTLNGSAVAQLNELAFIQGEIWANVWQQNDILRIDPATGFVKAIVDLSGLSEQTEVGGAGAVLNGIAWDAELERLLVTGKYWAKVFEIKLVAP